MICSWESKFESWFRLIFLLPQGNCDLDYNIENESLIKKLIFFWGGDYYIKYLKNYIYSIYKINLIKQ